MSDVRDHINKVEFDKFLENRKKKNQERLHKENIINTTLIAEQIQWRIRAEKLGASSWWKRLKCRLCFCRYTCDVDQDIEMSESLKELADLDGVEAFKIYATCYCSKCLQVNPASKRWFDNA